MYSASQAGNIFHISPGKIKLTNRAYIFLIVISISISWGGKIYPANADEQPASTINYAYAAWIGSGYYQVEDHKIYILRVPFGFTLIEQGSKKWGLDLLVPVTVGLDEFTDEEEKIASISIIPGVEGKYQVRDNWWLKPYGQIGIGQDFSYKEETWVWGYGLKSLAQFPYKKVLFELGNSVRYANNEHSGTGGDNGFSMWEIGLNAKLPVSWNIQKRPNDINFFCVYSGFMNDLELVSLVDDTIEITRLYKIGIAINSESNFSIFGIRFRGGGLTFTYGDGFTGIGVTTGFPF